MSFVVRSVFKVRAERCFNHHQMIEQGLAEAVMFELTVELARIL